MLPHDADVPCELDRLDVDDFLVFLRFCLSPRPLPTLSFHCVDEEDVAECPCFQGILPFFRAAVLRFIRTWKFECSAL